MAQSQTWKQFPVDFPYTCTLHAISTDFKKLNYFSKRTSFYQIKCIQLTHFIHDDIQNVGNEKGLVILEI